MSSGAARIERFLVAQGFERGPWLTIAFGFGIAAWFVLGTWVEWLVFLAAMGAICLIAGAVFGPHGRFPLLRQALIAIALLAAAGLVVVWTKSVLVGTPAIERSMVARMTGKITYREEDPAYQRVRLIVATKDTHGKPIQVRLNLPQQMDDPRIDEGAVIAARVRIVPPAPPMLPGAYDFALTAWFAGLSATGSVLDKVDIVSDSDHSDWLHRAQAALSHHVRTQLPGAAGTIADAYASGNQGAIPLDDQQAMRTAGLTHLLSISGLHVSAVIGAIYFLVTRLLGLWPWLALRVRLPVIGAGAGAVAGISYTLLTGSQVPTVRSCVGALLVLAALALGREALSLRMLAVGAFFVLLFWPEALAGPSFQLSFAAVLAIISLDSSEPVRRLLGPHEPSLLGRFRREIIGLLLTGATVELSLLPIGLFHFHRAGLYGVIANVVAIPLTTFVTMPLLGLALFLDLFHIGAPVWWLTGKSVDAMLGLAHWFSRQPGAVTWLPEMGQAGFALFVAGGLWLAMWRGHVRLWGFVPIFVGVLHLVLLRPADILISGDGRHVGITGDGKNELLVLRAGRDGQPSYSTDTLGELAGRNGDLRLLDQWQGARCNDDFCTATLNRGGREWHLLISRGQDAVPERAIAAACARVDIVIADRRLPRSCKPTWLKADRGMLDQTGGMTIDLANRSIRTVAQGEGDHGWWHPEIRPPFVRAQPSAEPSGTAARGPVASEAASGSATGRPRNAVARPAPERRRG